MHEPTRQVVSALEESFPDVAFAPAALMERGEHATTCEQTYLRVPADQLVAVMTFLRSDGRCAYEQLCDLTCVDYLNFAGARDRYGVVYSLLSLTRNHRLWVKCFVNDPNPEIGSVTGIWKGAEWLEREVWDMFGVRFVGHPDLRRILTWEDFKAHPLRKDYPLRGRGEREDYPVLTRDSR